MGGRVIHRAGASALRQAEPGFRWLAPFWSERSRSGLIALNGAGSDPRNDRLEVIFVSPDLREKFGWKNIMLAEEMPVATAAKHQRAGEFSAELRLCLWQQASQPRDSVDQLSFARQAGRIADLARENPKTAIAAGAAVALVRWFIYGDVLIAGAPPVPASPAPLAPSIEVFVGVST